MTRTYIRGTITEEGDFVSFAHLQGVDAVDTVQADVSNITVTVYKNGVQAAQDTNVSVTTGNPGSAAVIFNTLQTGAEWDEDSDGYNFRFHWQSQTGLVPFPAGTTMEGGDRVRIEHKITTTAAKGGIMWVITDLRVRAVSSA